MSTLKQLWTLLKVLWRTVIGELALSSILEVVSATGRKAADDLAEKAKIKVAKLEAEYPQDQPDLKRADAVNWLADYASANGVVVAASALGVLVELAVVALKTLGAQELVELQNTPLPGDPPVV